MDDLWAQRRADARRAAEPLASRMRPLSLAEVAGQRHIVGAGGLLPRMLRAGALRSIIFHGPPGVGKTSLAEVIAHETGAQMVRENASQVGVGRVREVMVASRRRVEEGAAPTVLFLDEIHRFNRAQQDALLGDVERGLLSLVGATTENPLFAVNSALVSRSTLFRLEPLSEGDVVQLLQRALADADRGLGGSRVVAESKALSTLATLCDGDARRALSALEIAFLSAAPGADGVVYIDAAAAASSIQRKSLSYDVSGDTHYDAISAMIKSLRGSDPDAALYWVAVMLEGAEDPRYIARRMAVFASEDIGNADPRAVLIAHACWDLVERIGMPEARITLGHCATYLALAPKSNASYVGIDAAIADVRNGRTRPVPLFFRDKRKADSSGSPQAGKGYVYPPSQAPNAVVGAVTGQGYMGVDARYYEPVDRGYESRLKERLDEILRLRREGG